MMQSKHPLLSIVGPTAVGKTSLGVRIASRFQGEIISADSMQIYRGMDIGTAKITEREKGGITHHLINILDPHEPYSVSLFQQHVRSAIQDIRRRKKLPILVGGTGLYIQSVTHGFEFPETSEDEGVRQKWTEYAHTYGRKQVHDILAQKDPAYAKKIHPNNVRRVIRALEVMETSNTRISDSQKEWNRPSPYHLTMIGLTMARSILYDRIDTRVDQMIAAGLIEEVRRLIGEGIPEKSTSMQAIGYKEIISFLKGQRSKQEAIELLKQNTRRFAKRQLTWFRRIPSIQWYDVSTSEQWSNQIQRIQDYVQESFDL